jgi:hypothetical protein
MSEVIIKFEPKEKGSSQPGLGSTLYVALKSWFDEIKEAPTTGTVAGQIVEIVDDHTFKNRADAPTKKYGFVKIPLMPVKTGEWDFKQDGEFPAVITSSSVKAAAVGLSAEQVEWIQGLSNKNAIIILEEKECQGVKKRVQIGCDCNPIPNVKFAYSSKDNILNIEAMAECHVRWYKGAISEYQY